LKQTGPISKVTMVHNSFIKVNDPITGRLIHLDQGIRSTLGSFLFTEKKNKPLSVWLKVLLHQDSSRPLGTSWAAVNVCLLYCWRHHYRTLSTSFLSWFNLQNRRHSCWLWLAVYCREREPEKEDCREDRKQTTTLACHTQAFPICHLHLSKTNTDWSNSRPADSHGSRESSFFLTWQKNKTYAAVFTFYARWGAVRRWFFPSVWCTRALSCTSNNKPTAK